MAQLNYKKIFALGVIAVIFAIIGWVLPITTTTNQTLGLNIVVNNTNLAPTVVGETNGTGERVSGITYYNNNSDIELFVWGHASSSGQTAELHLFINGTKVADTSGRPVGAAEQSNKSIIAIIPRYASYMIETTNTHHYEWREYQVLSGNVTSNITSTVNQSDLDLKVNKSGDTWTGNMVMDGTTINTNTVGDKDAYIYMESGLPTIRMRARTNGTSGYFELFPYYSDILVSGRRYNFTSTSLDMGNATITNVSQIQSTVTTGTAPFTIQSTTLNTNLNADLLDGLHASQITPADFVTHAELNAKANKSTIQVEQFRVGDDGAQNFTVLNSFLSYSTKVYVNGNKKALSIDYNETAPSSINISVILSQNDLVEVEYVQN